MAEVVFYKKGETGLNTVVRKRAKQMKDVLGERCGEVQHFISNLQGGTIRKIQSIKEQFRLTLVDAAAAYYAFNTYQL